MRQVRDDALIELSDVEREELETRCVRVAHLRPLCFAPKSFC